MIPKRRDSDFDDSAGLMIHQALFNTGHETSWVLSEGGIVIKEDLPAILNEGSRSCGALGDEVLSIGEFGTPSSVIQQLLLGAKGTRFDLFGGGTLSFTRAKMSLALLPIG